MKYPVFQLCVHYSAETDSFGLIFPQESENFLSMTFAIPITIEDYINQKLQTEFYFPSLQGNVQKKMKLKFDGIDKLNTEIFNTNIEFGLIENFPYKFHAKEYSSSIQRFHLLKYVGQYKEYTNGFLGFIPIRPINREGFSSIFESHKHTFIGFTPKFGDIDWLEK